MRTHDTRKLQHPLTFLFGALFSPPPLGAETSRGGTHNFWVFSGH